MPDPDDPDEAALRWAGDVEDRLDTSEPRPDRVVREPVAGRDSAALVVYGVFGGIYLLLTISWIITVSRLPETVSDAIGSVMYGVTAVLAVCAMPAWFIATFLLTRGRRLRVRFVALLAGALVLAPWVFLTGHA